MPRPRQERTVREASSSYWTTFLRKKNLIGPIMEEVTRAFIQPVEEVPSDPEFIEFLQIASAYGAPKNLSEFQKLSREEKLFYLEAYQEYLKEERKRKARESR